MGGRVLVCVKNSWLQGLLIHIVISMVIISFKYCYWYLVPGTIPAKRRCDFAAGDDEIGRYAKSKKSAAKRVVLTCLSFMISWHEKAPVKWTSFFDLNRPSFQIWLLPPQVCMSFSMDLSCCIGIWAWGKKSEGKHEDRICVASCKGSSPEYILRSPIKCKFSKAKWMMSQSSGATRYVSVFFFRRQKREKKRQKEEAAAAANQARKRMEVVLPPLGRVDQFHIIFHDFSRYFQQTVGWSMAVRMEKAERRLPTRPVRIWFLMVARRSCASAVLWSVEGFLLTFFFWWILW